jgi:hypothetical protein
VYAVFAAKVPVTVSGVEVPETDKETEGEDVAVYEVIADPPVAPAVKGTDKVVELVTVTVPMVGACGTVVAVMLLVSPDWIPTTPVDVTPVALNV